MPITVQHSPDFNLLGGVAAQAGFGMYQQRQDQQDYERFIQQQQLAQRQQESIARQQLAAQQQQLQAEAQYRSQMLDAARLGMIDQQNQYENKFKTQQLGLQDKWRIDEINQRNQLAERNNQFSWDAQTAGNSEKVVEDYRKNITQMELTPEGQRLRNELLRKLRGIQSARNDIRNPADYASNLSKWMEELHKSGLEDYTVKTPPPDQRLQSKMHKETAPQLDPITGQPQIDPNTGMPIMVETGRVYLEDSKGNWKLHEPPKQSSTQQNQNTGIPFAHGQTSAATKKPVYGTPHDPEAMPTFERYMANPENRRKEIDDAARDLLRENEADPSFKITPEKIEEKMRERYKLYERLAGVGQPVKKQGQDRPATPALTMQQAQDQHRNTLGELMQVQAEPDSPAKQVKINEIQARLDRDAAMINRIQETGKTDRNGDKYLPADQGFDSRNPNRFFGRQESPSTPGLPFWAADQVDGAKEYFTNQPAQQPVPPQPAPQGTPQQQVPPPPVPQVPPQMVPPKDLAAVAQDEYNAGMDVAKANKAEPEFKAINDLLVKSGIGKPNQNNINYQAISEEIRSMLGQEFHGYTGETVNNSAKVLVKRIEDSIATIEKYQGKKLSAKEADEYRLAAQAVLKFIKPR
jgi:hypothetical protein